MTEKIATKIETQWNTGLFSQLKNSLVTKEFSSPCHDPLGFNSLHTTDTRKTNISFC